MFTRVSPVNQGVSRVIARVFIPQVVCSLTVFCFVTSRIREHVSILNRDAQDAYPSEIGTQGIGILL